MYVKHLNRSYRITVTRFWLGCWLVLFCHLAMSETSTFVEVPKLERRVTDLTGTLNAEQSQALENKLAAFEAKKGSQIAVLIVPTTQPEDIAEFGIKVADLWHIGRKGVDDGMILIVAKNDRKLRLEVGYGLEGVIPDAIAKRIIAETITPYFKNGDFVGGVNAGVDQIIGLIGGEQLPAPKAAQQDSAQQDEGGFILLLLGGLFAGSVLSSLFGRTTGGLIAGIVSGAMAYLLLGFGIGAIIMGIVIFFLTSAHSTGGGGGWSNGGGYGGYYRGGGSSGGSWSGGGGGFGGGGSSGSW
ncbi:hypothetical protein MGMO_98c00050 [Methyloglobulus morosus KoM1]|uniref:TPM domain-containing protein n=2 Tax=Methyloglobulus TaxID=1410680 RepID=V5BZ17_9GAMM|nr:hypothetical protein MGMO_98c00050 [Methyloglobulus morosus KoM1]